MIQVRELTKTYSDLRNGQFVALAGVNFDANPGEIYGLLGPNGAGKTTLLRIMSTVLKPSGGSVKIGGYDVVKHPSPVRRSIGFVSNNTAVYDRMTAYEMVDYFGKLHGIEAKALEERIESIFSSMKMNDIREVLGSCLLYTSPSPRDS